MFKLSTTCVSRPLGRCTHFLFSHTKEEMKTKSTLLAVTAIGLGLTNSTWATNGDFLIGIGPISRALGGTGVAAPQDAISAVFSNPAAMCLSPICAEPQADFSLTFFMPKPEGSISNSRGNFGGESHDMIYPIPALGLSFPIGEGASRWRGGFSIYGVSGLGVNYRQTTLNQPGFFNFGPGGTAPVASGEYTDLAIMKMAPSIAYAVSPELSVGASFHVDYATLDLGQGRKNDFGLGLQLGVVWKPVKDWSFGLTYISPQSTTFDNVAFFDANPTPDSLELEMPHQVAAGIAWTGLDDRLLIELDGRWLNWSNAAGYKDFDWEDEWVIGLGVQYSIIPRKLWLRGGYNYGNNPVKNHSGWNGAFGPGMDMVNVQGKNIPRYYYESFRVIGFPAVVEHHLSLGMGWQINDCLTFNVSWVHAFSNTITESGTDPFGQPTTLSSKLSEDTVDLGLSWRY